MRPNLMKKDFLWLSIVGTFLVIAPLRGAISDESFQYFNGSEIDYWEKSKKAPEEKPTIPAVTHSHWIPYRESLHLVRSLIRVRRLQ